MSINHGNDDLGDILVNLDRMSPDKIRRKLGKYFTNKSVAEKSAIYIEKIINPKIIFEPYVGGGSLIDPLMDPERIFIVNDIEKNHIEKLERKYNQNIKYINENMITTPTQEIVDNWIGKAQENLLIYSNPPFGSHSTNKLSGRLTKNQKILIEYGNVAQYGKGDLVIPAIGKMIEVIKLIGDGHLAFFSPLGIFCGRQRYLKLLKGLLNDFEFLFGEIFSGDKFNDVKKNKPVSFTMWKYSPGIKTNFSNISFLFEESRIPIKGAELLKEYWSYDNRKKIKGEIAVQGNDRFNVQAPKILHSQVEKGGAELITENLKKSVNLVDRNIPDELAIGLWSLTVGYRSIGKHYPIYMDNAYTHLPDFNLKTVQEILSLTALHCLISELKNNYTNNAIRIDNKKIIFGGKRLTSGINYLLTLNSSLLINQKLYVKDIVESLKNHAPEILDTNLRKIIANEIESKLNLINYWDFIPISKSLLETM